MVDRYSDPADLAADFGVLTPGTISKNPRDATARGGFLMGVCCAQHRAGAAATELRSGTRCLADLAETVSATLAFEEVR